MFLIFLFSLFLSNQALAQNKTIVVAVIDTGFGKTEPSKLSKHLCKYGHRDFTADQKFVEGLSTTDKVPLDSHGHGTNIAGLIEQNAGNKKYCLVIIKTYSATKLSDSLTSVIKAFNYARKIKADYVNFSGGGYGKDSREIRAVKRYINSGGTFIAAAGNDHLDIEKTPYYPAMDDKRVIVVGSIRKDGDKIIRSTYSNFGKRVNMWDYGDNAIAYGLIMSGTSQATAITTGKLIAEKHKNMIKRRKELKLAK